MELILLETHYLVGCEVDLVGRLRVLGVELVEGLRKLGLGRCASLIRFVTVMI